MQYINIQVNYCPLTPLSSWVGSPHLDTTILILKKIQNIVFHLSSFPIKNQVGFDLIVYIKMSFLFGSIFSALFGWEVEGCRNLFSAIVS